MKWTLKWIWTPSCRYKVFSWFKTWALHGVWNWNFFYMWPLHLHVFCGQVSLLACMVLSACYSGLCSICISKNLTLKGTGLGVKIVFRIFYLQMSIYLQSSAEEEVVNQFADCCCSLRLCSILTWKGFWSKWLKSLLEMPIDDHRRSCAVLPPLADAVKLLIRWPENQAPQVKVS